MAAELIARLNAICCSAPDFIMHVARDGEITYINRTVPSLTIQEVVGTRVSDWIESNDDSFERALEQAFLTGEVQHIEFLATPQPPRWYACRIAPIVEDNNADSAVVIARDMTEQRQAESELRAEQALLKRLFQLRELERQLISEEIHDGFVQDIVGAKMALEGGLSELHDEGVTTGLDALDAAVEQLSQALVEARRMVADLSLLTLEDEGLVPSLELLVVEAKRRHGLNVAFQSSLSDRPLSPLLAGSLFRIVQEAIANVARHSGVVDASVSLVEREQTLVVEVRDQGVGFEPLQVPEDRYGVRGITERARAFGGQAHIESSPGLGTVVCVEFPLEESLCDTVAACVTSQTTASEHFGRTHSTAPSRR